ncbi:DUF1128 domain-containing protein [Natribacillus halophilus]|uniref:Uncharacterized protein YfkK, UPF0435 family n=1 Tax=Natribacillus halophilus TaxID=549003 RepID=A0A1G8MIH5_9BACI|nr:DUF1128 family protein [Natribacillus halophilus]SDI67808.1 Uncharacterized protein YfkK, UPF0435 family [Natribacillus halophilus]
MNLDEATEENLNYIFEKLQENLQVVNAVVLDPASYDLYYYDDIKEIYDYVTGQSNISVNEMEALVSELGRIKVASDK